MIKYYINFLIFSFITLILVFSCAILIQYNIAHALLFAIASFFVSLLSLYIYFSFIHDKLSNTIGTPLSKKEKELITLKTAEKYRREFFGNVSHELKTPIFNIQGYVETLIDGALYDEKVNKKYLLRTSKSVDRLIYIIRDLESIAQLESSELKLEITKWNLKDLINEIIDQFEIKAAQKKIQFIHMEESTDLFVLADKDKMSQVFSNLISNSIKYGKKQGSTKIQLHQTKSKCIVMIKDTGIGIAEKHLKRLFERFYRVDKSRSRIQGGTGLGLAIVKHIIEAHDQTISVKSRLSHGTEFVFSLKCI
jgi:two-component system phosphate regulon sensor histidine kinase PhoR